MPKRNSPTSAKLNHPHLTWRRDVKEMCHPRFCRRWNHVPSPFQNDGFGKWVSGNCSSSNKRTYKNRLQIQLFRVQPSSSISRSSEFRHGREKRGHQDYCKPERFSRAQINDNHLETNIMWSVTEILNHRSTTNALLVGNAPIPARNPTAPNTLYANTCALPASADEIESTSTPTDGVNGHIKHTARPR